MSAADEIRGLRREINALRREVRELREALDNVQVPYPYVPYVPYVPSPSPYLPVYPYQPYITWRGTYGGETVDQHPYLDNPRGLSSPVEMT